MANKLNVKALAITGGFLWGAYLFLAALFAMGGIEFWWFNSALWEFLVVTFSGLSATLVGAVIGAVWGFVCGAVCGGLIAWVYNWADSRWK